MKRWEEWNFGERKEIRMVREGRGVLRVQTVCHGKGLVKSRRHKRDMSRRGVAEMESGREKGKMGET